MTTVELLAYCRAQWPETYAPDLIWQRETHLKGNLEMLCAEEPGSTPSNGFNEMRESILEPCSWLLRIGRHYATVLFEGRPACSEPQR